MSKLLNSSVSWEIMQDFEKLTLSKFSGDISRAPLQNKILSLFILLRHNLALSQQLELKCIWFSTTLIFISGKLSLTNSTVLCVSKPEHRIISKFLKTLGKDG